MEEAKGLVKHVLLAKFKDSTPPDQIEELIKGYANLVNLVPPMKAFHWYFSSIWVNNFASFFSVSLSFSWDFLAFMGSSKWLLLGIRFWVSCYSLESISVVFLGFLGFLCDLPNGYCWGSGFGHNPVVLIGNWVSCVAFFHYKFHYQMLWQSLFMVSSSGSGDFTCLSVFFLGIRRICGKYLGVISNFVDRVENLPSAHTN